MITDYLKAGFPAILLQTQEPHRADELMRRIPEWQICRWDCVSGVHGMAPSSFTLNEIQNPVEAVQWLSPPSIRKKSDKNEFEWNPK